MIQQQEDNNQCTGAHQEEEGMSGSDLEVNLKVLTVLNQD